MHMIVVLKGLVKGLVDCESCSKYATVVWFEVKVR